MARPISLTIYIYIIFMAIKLLWEWPWTPTQVFWFFYAEVVHSSRRLWNWCWAPTETTRMLHYLDAASNYDAWSAAAFALDRHLNYDIWRQDNNSNLYDFRLIEQRHWLLHQALQDQKGIDVHRLTNLLQTGLSRNLGRITHPQLYNRAFHGTKTLIAEYVLLVVDVIEKIANYPTSRDGRTDYTDDQKITTFSNAIRAYGHSVLVLQGGAMFGLCHLGVVKALLERRLLPHHIVGSETGALIAALVCVHTQEELPRYLTSSGIDLTAFTNRPYRNNAGIMARLNTLIRRLERRRTQGHFLDIHILEAMLQANLGDVTFNEAHKRTGMVLNIIVTGADGEPILLNYLTAPYVLIWSAALASNATSYTRLYRPVTVMSKYYDGSIVPWLDPRLSVLQPSRRNRWKKRLEDSPLNEIRKQFNVNHFIVSQAQPYLAPFLRTDLHRPNIKHRGLWKISIVLLQQFAKEVRLRLHQINQMGWLPSWAARCVLDEHIPGLSLTLVPKLEKADFLRLLDQPVPEAIDYWISKGERSVWPAVKALKTRCVIEVELGRALESSKRRTSPQPSAGAHAVAGPSGNTAHATGGSSSNGVAGEEASRSVQTIATTDEATQHDTEVPQPSAVNGPTILLTEMTSPTESTRDYT